MLDELREIREGIAKQLMIQEGMNPDWFYDNRSNVAEAEKTCQEYEAKADQILSYLAKKGVCIPTPHGIMMLSDLLKKEDKCPKN